MEHFLSQILVEINPRPLTYIRRRALLATRCSLVKDLVLQFYVYLKTFNTTADYFSVSYHSTLTLSRSFESKIDWDYSANY